MSKALLGSVCALVASALLSGTAMAQLMGSVNATYTNVSGSGTNVDSWGGSGALQFPLGSTFGAQIDTGYNNLSGNGASVDLWQVGGVGGFTGANWRAAADVRYYNFNSMGSANFTTYGGGVEFYPNAQWTVGVNGGWITGEETGNYYGGAIKFYPCPRFVASGAIDYTWFGSHDYQTTYGVKGEYALSSTTPISAYVGYSYSSYSGGANANLYSAGITFYIDNSTGNTGGTNLAYEQRNGQYGWMANGPGAFNAVY